MNERTPKPTCPSATTADEFDFDSIHPLELEERMDELRIILDDENVPHPVPTDVGKVYYALAASGVPFDIGSLSDSTADVGTYRSEQIYENVTLEDHASWACLVKSQQAAKSRYACKEYIVGEQLFQIGGNLIPDYYALNARIFQQTGWQLAAVNEIIPAHVFFHCHSHKFFPVTTFMRPLGTDYLAEPDIGHDIAGHVATFTIPQVAAVMNNHGLANDQIHLEKEEKLKTATTEAEATAIRDEATELLLYAGRLYWFTVEFGLVMESGLIKAFGAGILSSPGETKHSVDSPDSNRILIDPSNDQDLLRMATTDYLITEFQKTYFVLKNFESLSTLTPDRILTAAKAAMRLPHHTWRELVPGDNVVNVGKVASNPNEKYGRLITGLPIDECCERAAVRNLTLFAKPDRWTLPEDREFIEALPEIPSEIQSAFIASEAFMQTQSEGSDCHCGSEKSCDSAP